MTANDVVVLAGGTGGAKLARGMTAVLDPERVAVIANTTNEYQYAIRRNLPLRTPKHPRTMQI